jgi:hypothetical protein
MQMMKILAGTLTIFNPSSTTYVKHFIATTNMYKVEIIVNDFTAGYGNTTSAVNASTDLKCHLVT